MTSVYSARRPWEVLRWSVMLSQLWQKQYRRVRWRSRRTAARDVAAACHPPAGWHRKAVCFSCGTGLRAVGAPASAIEAESIDGDLGIPESFIRRVSALVQRGDSAVVVAAARP